MNRLRTELDLQQPTGLWTNAFAYDAAKRLTNVVSPAGSFAYAYASASSHLPKKISLPGSYITNTYDNVARMTGTFLKNGGGTVLNSHQYVYNVGNQRTNQTFYDAAVTAYTYGPIGQLKWANSSVNAEDRGYLYDAAWNLNTRTNNGVVGTLSVNSKNEISGCGGSFDFGSFGPYEFDYDGNGNITNIADDYLSLRYTYDDENRLISLEHYNLDSSEREGLTQFLYDGLGRLRARTEFDFDLENWPVTLYVYDGKRVIQERLTDNADEYFDEGVPTVSYTRGNDLSASLEGAGGIGGLLARSHGYVSGSFTNHNFYHAGGNGNITAMVNSSPAVVARYKYDPYGNTISQSGGALAHWNVYRFSSKELTSAGYYYGYRFYDPYLQRWLNRDPIYEWGGQNLYTLTKNNPVDWIDPVGYQAQWPPPLRPPIYDPVGPMGPAWDPNYEPGHFHFPHPHHEDDLPYGPRPIPGCFCPPGKCPGHLVPANPPPHHGPPWSPTGPLHIENPPLPTSPMPPLTPPYSGGPVNFPPAM